MVRELEFCSGGSAWMSIVEVFWLSLGWGPASAHTTHGMKDPVLILILYKG